MKPLISGEIVDFFGFRYVVPPFEIERQTIIAINLGGCVIPVLISFFLIQMVDSIDLVMLPPFLAAGLALMISPQSAPMLAYISGTLGSLIGADLLNLKKILNLGTPLAFMEESEHRAEYLPLPQVLPLDPHNLCAVFRLRVSLQRLMVQFQKSMTPLELVQDESCLFFFPQYVERGSKSLDCT